MPTKTIQADLMANKIAEQIHLKSHLLGPIDELDEIRQALLFAEVSMISYMKPEEFEKAAGRLGFAEGKYFVNHGSHAYWLSNVHDSVIVCREAEPTSWKQLNSELHAVQTLAETVGRVHSGWKKRADGLWPQLEQAIFLDRRKMWFTGHSLGGAVASICAYRCLLSAVQNEPVALYTFGSPRVGSNSYVTQATMRHVRWVNNNDLVPRLPPTWLGYRHFGDEHYINHKGETELLTGWRRTRDRLRGFFKSLTKFRIDHFRDHLVTSYVNALARIAKKEGP